MARDFTEDDRDKEIVTSDGNRVGRISDVNQGRAQVETNDDDGGLTDKIKDMLDWGDDDDDHELRSEHVDRHEDDRVYLRDR